MRLRTVHRCAALAALGLSVGAATLAAASAPGDTTLSGTTAEETKVKLTVAEFGNATAFKIGATEAQCDEGSLNTDASTFKRFDTSDPGEFADKRKSAVEDGRFLLKDTFKITGLLAEDESGWTGTYEQSTKVLKNGHKVDSCLLSTTWKAS